MGTTPHDLPSNLATTDTDPFFMLATHGEGGTLGGHASFRILSLLKYVVDIGKSSPNPKHNFLCL